MEAKKSLVSLRARNALIALAATFAAAHALAQSTATYTYDALGRVVTATDSSGTTTYNYDAAGNRTLVATTGANRPPVANPDSTSTTAGTPVTINPRGNDSDPDGDPITVTSVGTASNGSTSYSSTTVTYTPAAGFTGNNSFSYTISDGRGLSASSTVSVSVTGAANQPPVANNDAFMVSAALPEMAEGCIAVLANDSDPNGDPLTIASFTQASSGTVYQWGTALCYRVAPSNTVRTFTYTISDGRGGTATATVTVTVRRDTF